METRRTFPLRRNTRCADSFHRAIREGTRCKPWITARVPNAALELIFRHSVSRKERERERERGGINSKQRYSSPLHLFFLHTLSSRETAFHYARKADSSIGYNGNWRNLDARRLFFARPLASATIQPREPFRSCLIKFKQKRAIVNCVARGEIPGRFDEPGNFAAWRETICVPRNKPI